MGIQDDCDEAKSLVPADAEPASSVSPRPRSKNSSVSETPVVSIERSGMSPTDAMSPGPVSGGNDGLISPPLVNGETKPVMTSSKSGNEREGGSISPRQQSLDVSGQKMTYAQIIQKKKEKEAKEAAERAAKEAEEGQADATAKGKEDKVTVSAPAENDAATPAPAKKEEQNQQQN